MSTKIIGVRKYGFTDEKTKKLIEGHTFFLAKDIELNRDGEVIGHGLEFPKINSVSVSLAKAKDVYGAMDVQKMVGQEVIVSFDENQKPLHIDLVKKQG